MILIMLKNILINFYIISDGEFLEKINRTLIKMGKGVEYNLWLLGCYGRFRQSKKKD